MQSGQRGISDVVGHGDSQRTNPETTREVHDVYQAVFLQAHETMIIADSDGVIVDWNDEASRVYGISRCEAIGASVYDILMHTAAEMLPADTQSKMRDHVTRLFASVSGEPARVERQVRSVRDGRLRTIEGLAFHVDTVSERRLCIIGRDVTKTRRLEHELAQTNERLEGAVAGKAAELEAANQALLDSIEIKSALLHEVHHRVKNNLQFMLSLIRLTGLAGYESFSEFLESTERRLQLMTVVYEQLLSSDDYRCLHTGNTIPAVVEDIVGRRTDRAARIRCEVDVDDIEFSVDSMIPLIFIVGEIVTNSVDHAFREQAAGNVAVSLKRVDERLLLLIRDDGTRSHSNLEGVGSEAALLSDAIGCGLIDLLIDQLRGSYHVEYEGGTAYHIYLPLDLEFTEGGALQ
jgi:PAS domain S-box-containing protein